MAPPLPAPLVTARSGPSRYRGPALLLMLPAALTGLLTLVVPSVQTSRWSLRRGFLYSSHSVGLRNYTMLLGNGRFWSVLGLSLALAVVPLLVAIVVGPALAAALEVAGTWPRRAGRILLSLPLVVFSPAAITAAWTVGDRPGDHGPAARFGPIGDGTIMLITAAGTFGVVCGLALLVYLPVLRGRAEGRRVVPAMVAVGSIGVLAIIAAGLQAFSVPAVIGMRRGSGTLMTLYVLSGFEFADLGGGATVVTVTGLLLGVLGVAATVIAIQTGLFIRPAADGPPERDRPAVQPTSPRQRSRAPIGILALVLVAIVLVACSWPWLSAYLATSGDPARSTDGMYVNTWVPPLLSTIVSVGTAFPAALAIGGLRPLGRRSEWLLLPFAPWLFAGCGTLSVGVLEDLMRLKLIGRFPALMPPILLSVPSLLILTLFCRGCSGRWRARTAAGAPAGPAFLRTVVGPALPLAGLLAGANVLVGAQGLLWQELTVTSDEGHPAPVTLHGQVQAIVFSGATSGVTVRITTPIVMVVLALAALIVLQLRYLDRLVIATGDPDAPAGTGMPAGPAAVPAGMPPYPWPGGPAPSPGPSPVYGAPPPYGPPPAYGPPPHSTPPPGYGLPPAHTPPPGHGAPPYGPPPPGTSPPGTAPEQPEHAEAASPEASPPPGTAPEPEGDHRPGEPPPPDRTPADGSPSSGDAHADQDRDDTTGPRRDDTAI